MSRLRVTAAMLLAAACFALPAAADGFDARPITLETRDGLGTFVITNAGEHRIYLETQVYDWSQDAAGHETLSEAQDAIASPPATWVGPRSTYALRVMLPAGTSGRERAYRVVIRQLPDRSDVVAGKIVFALTQSLPAFFEPPDAMPPSLRARLVDAHHLLISNDGGRRVRLANLVQSGRMIARGLVGYALEGSAIAVPIRTSLHRGSIEIETDVGRRIVAVR